MFMFIHVSEVSGVTALESMKQIIAITSLYIVTQKIKHPYIEVSLKFIR